MWTEGTVEVRRCREEIADLSSQRSREDTSGDGDIQRLTRVTAGSRKATFIWMEHLLWA